MGVITTVQEAIDFVHNAYQFGSKLGLENMQLLLSKMGNPHLRLKFIHVAGTNGKGSTCAIMSQALIEAGYKVGTYVSPYLEFFNERIQVNRLSIDDHSLVAHAEIVRAAIQSMLEEGAPHPTEFEIVTAIGFSYFSRELVDLVVLEVGLGGRLDATNVIQQPLAAVITPVDYDHMQYLGNTLSEIASEKAGIIKGGLVICAKQQEEAIQSVMLKAKETNSRLVWSDHTRATGLELNATQTQFVYRNLAFELHMLGAYQVQNACTAIDTLLALRDENLLQIGDDALVKGVKRALWAGRFEQIHENPRVFIDGAHNLHGVEAFKQAIDTYHADLEKIAVFGMLRDKEVKDVLGLIAHSFKAIYTVVPDNPRALSHDELDEVLGQVNYRGKIAKLERISDIKSVIANYQGSEAIIYCFGSLYYIGEVRRLLYRHE